jgi:hypothetical protein
MQKVNLIKDVQIPDFAEEAVFLQSTLLQVTEANIEEIVSQLAINFPDPTETDMDKFASNIYTIAKVRPKDQKTYAMLMAVIQLYFGKNFDTDTILCAPPWFLRHLYLQGLIDLEKIKIRCDERSYYKPFFLPELGYEKINLRGQFLPLSRNYESLAENDFKKFKEVLEFGYAKDTAEYAIKNDDVEYVKKHANEIKKVSMSTIEQNIFSDNTFPIKINEVWDESYQSLEPIILAAHYGSLNCFKYYAEKSTINVQVLAEACYGGNEEIIKMCTDKTINTGRGKIGAILALRNDVYDSIANTSGENVPRNWSARAGNILALLNEINDEKNENLNDISRIMTAAENGNYGAVEVLYYKGFSISNSDRYGTCLCRAACCGHIPVVRQLLGFGANWADGNNQSRIPELTCKNNQIAIIRLMMKNGLRYSHQDSYMNNYVKSILFPNTPVANTKKQSMDKPILSS